MVVHVVLMVVIVVVVVVVVVVVCAAHSFTPTPFLYAHPSDHYFPAYFIFTPVDRIINSNQPKHVAEYQLELENQFLRPIEED